MLLWHLNQFQWIELPGIGFFEGSKILAKIDEPKSKIFPSSLSVSLNPQAHQKTEEMVGNIVLETGYDKDDVEQAIAELVYHLGNELRVRKEVNFQPFGKLFYSSEHNVLQFHPTGSNLHNQFFGMTEYPLKKIQDTTILQTINTKYTNEIIPSNQSPRFNRNLLYLLGLLWLLFLGLLFCPAKKTKNHPINSIKKESTTTEEKYSNITDSSTTELTDSSVKDTLISQDINKENTDKNNTTPTQEFTREEEITSDKIENLNKEVKNKKCVIIVGSFKKSSNAKRLVLRVKKFNYKVYTERFGEFNRVGVSFDCIERDLKTVLEELKKQFTNEAWILKY